MAVGTALWAIQDAIIASLVAERALGGSPLAGKPITLGYPGRLSEDHIFLAGEADEWRQKYGVSNLGAKDEELTLRLYVFVKLNTDSYAEARAYLAPISARIEQRLNEQFTLAGSTMLVQVSRLRLEEALTGDQPASRELLLTMYLSCRSWLA